MRREIVRLCALLLALCWLVGPALAAPLEAEPPVALTSPSAMLVEDVYKRQVYVQSWKACYQGLLPQAFLDKLTHDRWSGICLLYTSRCV